MKAKNLHRWDVTPAEAREIQIRLRECLECERGADKVRTGKVQLVAGCDLAFRLPGRRSWERGTGRAIAGVVVFTFPELVEVERVSIELPLTFPYVPGLLSFREVPALLAVFARLRHEPDLIFCDGHGYAHPRRFGLACHLGMLLGRPTIGCAKSLLIGDYREPAAKAGSWTPLLAPHTNDAERPGKREVIVQRETIGAAVRTRTGVKPIFVSQGYRISLARAIKFALAVCDGFRIPRPTREADLFVESVKRTTSSSDARRSPAP
ncbi:MAG: endonuclease V [Candidatus Acidiferrales bacterium]